MDKGNILFILLKKLGSAYIDETVSDQEITEALRFIKAD